MENLLSAANGVSVPSCWQCCQTTNQMHHIVKGERWVKQSTGLQKTKMISLVDIWMPGMPRIAAVHFWLCLCGDE